MSEYPFGAHASGNQQSGSGERDGEGMPPRPDQTQPTVKTPPVPGEGLVPADGDGAGKGDAKLSYVQDELESRGLKVDAAAIEAMVREMNLMGNWEAEFEVVDEAEDAEAGHDGEA